MTANVTNQVSYLRTSRQFPEDLRQLTIEITKTYIDLANAINNRVISIFSKNVPSITGENWFITNQRQQGFRQIYTFTSAGSIPHFINFTNVFAFVKIYGTFTNGTNWYPLPYVDVTAANNQVNIIVTPTNIVITGGSGGGQPTITSGFVVLEWITNI